MREIIIISPDFKQWETTGKKVMSFFNMRLIMIWTAALTIFVGAPLANAITLQDAKEEAFRANLNIKAAKEKVLESQSIRKERFTNFFPTVYVKGYGIYVHEEPRVKLKSGEYGTYSLIGPFPDKDISIARGEQDTYKVALQLKQPVFTGGRIYFSYLQAKAHEEEDKWDKQQVIQDILFGVEQAYFSLLKAKEIKKLAEQHEKTIKAHMANMELRYEKGRMALNDVLRVKVEVERTKELVIKADNELSVAEMQLNLILNRPIDQLIGVTPVVEPTPITITIKDAEKLALLNRPSLKVARAQRQEALFNRRVAESDYYPDFKFVAEYIRQTEQPNTEPENWSVMLMMEYPLWEWGGTGHKVNTAKAIEQQSKYYISAFENQIAFEVRQTWLQIQEADKRIEVVKEAMVHAEENLRITQLGFSNGVKTSTDVLDAEELLSRTRSEYVQAKYDAYFARSILRYVMGKMKIEDVSGGS